MTAEPCGECGLATPIELLDAKPAPGHFTLSELQQAADRGEDFERLECERCYGPGYVRGDPNDSTHLKGEGDG